VSNHSETPPLILVTNDDGITSPGLRAAALAASALGEVLIVAPSEQRSGAARSLPHHHTGSIVCCPLEVAGERVAAYQVDGSPAATVQHALMEVVPRRPALVVSGINYGENLGADVSISGTVGAALEAAVNGLPALAASLQTPKAMHTQPSEAVDFTAAIHFARLFGRLLLEDPLPFDVDVLCLNVPDTATPDTPWRLTRASRHTYFVPLPPQRDKLVDPMQIDYEAIHHPEQTEPDSDIYALAVDRVVSVAPLSRDLASRVDRGVLEEVLRGPKWH
jgi:5'-nucleotidase